MKAEYDFYSATRWQEQEQEDTEVLSENSHRIIVWNDDVNTFDWVIDSLMDICQHTLEQAEQCALIIHHAGKYAVKEGDFDVLRPQAEALIDRGINATME
ncbi:MAG: ATP-dependent Clp protease adaptor ClpS [Chitinophagaceae bacterium]